MSTEPTWRVYLQEWLTVYTSDAINDAGSEEAADWFRRHYAGRVRAEDWTLRQIHVNRPSEVRLRLPNLKGESKDKAEADRLATRIFEPPAGCVPEVVQRGSEQEKELLAYGKKMLPDAG